MIDNTTAAAYIRNMGAPIPSHAMIWPRRYRNGTGPEISGTPSVISQVNIMSLLTKPPEYLMILKNGNLMLTIFTK